jgi:hypothetical protein
MRWRSRSTPEDPTGPVLPGKQVGEAYIDPFGRVQVYLGKIAASLIFPVVFGLKNNHFLRRVPALLTSQQINNGFNGFGEVELSADRAPILVTLTGDGQQFLIEPGKPIRLPQLSVLSVDYVAPDWRCVGAILTLQGVS